MFTKLAIKSSFKDDDIFRNRSRFFKRCSFCNTNKTNYINMPLLANVYVAKGLAFKLGIQPALNVESGFLIDDGPGGSLSDAGIDINEFDVAIPLGVSYEYKNFVIEGRYNLGLTKIYEHDASKHSVFQFTIGYKIDL